MVWVLCFIISPTVARLLTEEYARAFSTAKLIPALILMYNTVQIVLINCLPVNC